jgi:hypothetical protein
MRIGLITAIILMMSSCIKQPEQPPQPGHHPLEEAHKEKGTSLPPNSGIAPNSEIAPGAPSSPGSPPISVDDYYGDLRNGGGGGGDGPRAHEPTYIHFVPNSYAFWTNPLFATTHLIEGCTGENCECNPGDENCEALPAFANILLDESNFVWCKGGPYAVCYYSGPNDGSTDLSCELTSDGRFANCKCFEVAWGVYFVDINAILNWEIYQKTINVCGQDGSLCSGPFNVNVAPVCEAINKNKFIPEADLISTFSFSCVPTNGLGQTNCSENLYAGCMTAPCQRTAEEGIVECSCPIFSGPYQVGTTLATPEEECTLGEGLVWSAAFTPAGSTIPPTSPCIPDAPGGNGCPLYDDSMMPPGGTDCEAICEAYACMNENNIQPAYTCDATLCTGECNEQDLIKSACEDLAACPAAGLVAIADLEAAVECSCCASQLCGCGPNEPTNNLIFELNQEQRNKSITPQCDINGTLCGAPTQFSSDSSAKINLPRLQ